MKEFIKASVCLIHTIIFFGITFVLQVLGYGTAPGIDARYNSEITSEELSQIVETTISDFNTTFYIEIGIVGIIVLGLNYFILNKMKSKYTLIISIVILLIYLIPSLYTLSMNSDKFRAINSVVY